MDLEEYDYIRVLDKGSFGVIYLVERKEDSAHFAIKQQEIDDYNFAKNEEEIMKKLNHPNIVAFYKSWENEGKSIILMEYVSGTTFYDLVQKAYENCQDPMSEIEALSFFAQLALGVDHMHQHDVIHRDLKPENILLAGSDRKVKIIDFGLSKDISAELEVITVNPNSYTAPENWSKNEPYTFKSDIWSIGSLLYEAITGVEPKDLQDDLESLEDLPMSIAIILQNILQLVPDERPESNEILRYGELKSALMDYYQTLEPSEQEIVRPQINHIIDSEEEIDK